MKAVILSGGFGTRLKSVINDVPKPMANVGEKCFLELLLENLKKNGINDFIFCVCYMSEKIINYFGDGSKFGVKISYSIEKIPLGTGGAIGLLRNSIDETFCVLNGDTFLELDMYDFIKRHNESGLIASMAVTKVDDISRFGQVITDDEGHITKFCEKNQKENKSGFINAGLCILEPKIFDYIPEDKPVSFEKDILNMLLKDKQKISTYSKVNNFFDIGIPGDYYKFQRWITKRKI